MIKQIESGLVEISESDLETVNGGDLLTLSSAFGHLGRAFALGYAIGTGIVMASDWLSEQNTGSGEYVGA